MDLAGPGLHAETVHAFGHGAGGHQDDLDALPVDLDDFIDPPGDRARAQSLAIRRQ